MIRGRVASMWAMRTKLAPLVAMGLISLCSALFLRLVGRVVTMRIAWLRISSPLLCIVSGIRYSSTGAVDYGGGRFCCASVAVVHTEFALYVVPYVRMAEGSSLVEFNQI